MIRNPYIKKRQRTEISPHLAGSTANNTDTNTEKNTNKTTIASQSVVISKTVPVLDNHCNISNAVYNERDGACMSGDPLAEESAPPKTLSGRGVHQQHEQQRFTPAASSLGKFQNKGCKAKQAVANPYAKKSSKPKSIARVENSNTKARSPPSDFTVHSNQGPVPAKNPKSEIDFDDNSVDWDAAFYALEKNPAAATTQISSSRASWNTGTNTNGNANTDTQTVQNHRHITANNPTKLNTSFGARQVQSIPQNESLDRTEPDANYLECDMDWNVALLELDQKSSSCGVSIASQVCKERDILRQVDTANSLLLQSSESNHLVKESGGKHCNVFSSPQKPRERGTQLLESDSLPPSCIGSKDSLLPSRLGSNNSFGRRADICSSIHKKGEENLAKPTCSKVTAPLKLDRPASWGATQSCDFQMIASSLSNDGGGSGGPPRRPGSSSSTTSNLASSLNNAHLVQWTANGTLPSLPAELAYTKDRVQPVPDEHRKTLVKNANLSSPLLNGWTLFSHQKKAILRGLLMRRMILALDMGLGKTLIGCVWSKAFKRTFPTLKTYVICPVSLKMEWKRTAQEATGLEVQEEKANSKIQDPEKMCICSWAKIPKVPAEVLEYVVVCDEAHSMQSLQSARTRETLELVTSKRCVGVLLLTGTPMKNGKPLNLFPLLKAVRHPFGDRQKAFEIQFCAGQEKNYGRGRIWDANGSSNLPSLRAHAASHLLHMTKEQCLKELPPQTRTFEKVAVSSRHQLQHNVALNNLAKLYETCGSFESSGDAILGAVQRVRQIGSFAKIDATVALAKRVLETQPAIVIFTSFCLVAKTVHKKLSESGWTGELLMGETPALKRQGMVDNFQAGLVSVFVCTFGAGGVGLTLTAAHTIVLLDRPWTPGDASQAEDRIRRIGQTKPVTSVWMVAFDLDSQIDSVIEQKKKNSNAVLQEGSENDDSGGNASAPPPKISIFKLLKSVLPKACQVGVTVTPVNGHNRN